MEKEKVLVDNILNRTEDRYTLINLAAKRARVIVESNDNMKMTEAINRTIEEIREGKLRVKTA
ncbi:DNA-directed RNA polymerase subunit omega [Candidatus Desantisbacteria bacterium CG_4_10_14_0_8_um_filter_48_22]|uniref:DNA-directed RNA polymerase subunit omega n=1 Tax=Candidatus Desantisbacteria bacterium CG_4_10_14_0_8_um_filter_48_22 TaxID=1974543 RepID=A0A2M7SB19_9BACT|nr:MAG: DNA-directed RNA polymerase subunit omega [Candidatus Desantisbacteria bacterium CG02_land_8_20_14_3_00_49_13]PIZ16659.1 MAG: DNA-directed RNA polymerase subunit omega [Candidatus Desantisbacteria bacterium CG_4_10_14_0_8_um_filter_48_22]PJB28966.1 MAG: DNA-directed RNA polymerase subunit omega [Candidatus Desantisbacteria bacterium CG_4_9_14_3_um_filter_50_7]